MPTADVILVAAGRGGRPGESHLDLLRENAAVDTGRIETVVATLVANGYPADMVLVDYPPQAGDSKRR